MQTSALISAADAERSATAIHRLRRTSLSAVPRRHPKLGLLEEVSSLETTARNNHVQWMISGQVFLKYCRKKIHLLA
ncbi:hypothetical protein TNCV_2341131 [Trichonephila clavipes]|nr:hypothetical protein TNCV_2341131 [Trichonephila clavipes]